MEMTDCENSCIVRPVYRNRTIVTLFNSKYIFVNNKDINKMNT
jgi:hypothetical protein